MIGVMSIVSLASGLLWVPFTLKYTKYQDRSKIRQEAHVEASKRINEDMKKACKCWYTDSRCNAPATRVVVCSMSEFMRHTP